MKKIPIYFLAAAFCALSAGCYKDKGNYDYRDAESIPPVILSELASSYDAVLLERLVIDPQIKEDSDDYEYLWYMFVTNISSTANDTIGRARKLDYLVTAQTGTYRLVFKVTDKRNGTSAYQESIVVVSSNFSKGYYILKYENGRTDVDFVDRAGTVNPGILKQITGEDMPGTPVKQVYSSARYCYGPDASQRWQPAYIVCTDQDLRIFHGSDLSLIKTWETAFREAPAVRKPQGLWATSGSGFMMMNDNSMHALASSTYSQGNFGAAFLTTGIKFSPYVAVAASGYQAFDENAGTFLGFTGSTGNIISHDYAASTYPNVTGYDLVWMGAQQAYNSTYAAYSYALVKSRADGSHMLVETWAQYMQNFGFYFTNNFNVPADFGIIDGKVFACMGGTGNTVIYYSTGDNVVHYYNPNNQSEKRSILSIPAGEEIVQLKHVYFDYPALGPPVDIFVVLAKVGNNWKVYAYEREGSTPDILESSVVTYSGTGVPYHIMHRDPLFRMTY